MPPATINRFLEFYVCESKRLAERVAINEQGGCTDFFNSRRCGVPSPLEQNRRHITVLESVFKTGQVPPTEEARTDDQGDDDWAGTPVKDRPDRRERQHEHRKRARAG